MHICVLLICYGTNPLSLRHPKHFQAGGDNQLLLPVAGQGKKKKGYGYANSEYC